MASTDSRRINPFVNFVSIIELRSSSHFTRSSLAIGLTLMNRFYKDLVAIFVKAGSILVQDYQIFLIPQKMT